MTEFLIACAAAGVLLGMMQASAALIALASCHLTLALLGGCLADQISMERLALAMSASLAILQLTYFAALCVHIEAVNDSPQRGRPDWRRRPR